MKKLTFRLSMLTMLIVVVGFEFWQSDYIGKEFTVVSRLNGKMLLCYYIIKEKIYGVFTESTTSLHIGSLKGNA